MTRSPIEQMIDAACGFDPNAPQPKRDLVELKCPDCGIVKMVDRDKTDPQACMRVIFPCLKCFKEGDRPEAIYYDGNGRQIDCDGNLITQPTKE